eukprot:6100224-Alexandrium_andersonii.AAC.1
MTFANSPPARDVLACAEASSSAEHVARKCATSCTLVALWPTALVGLGRRARRPPARPLMLM